MVAGALAALVAGSFAHATLGVIKLWKRPKDPERQQLTASYVLVVIMAVGFALMWVGR